MARRLLALSAVGQGSKERRTLSGFRPGNGSGTSNAVQGQRRLVPLTVVSKVGTRPGSSPESTVEPLSDEEALRRLLGEADLGTRRLQHLETHFLDHFRIEIFWDPSRRRFLVAIPGHPGVVGKGPTRDSALQNLRGLT